MRSVRVAAIVAALLAAPRIALAWGECPDGQYSMQVGDGEPTVCCYNGQHVESGRCVGPTPFQPSWEVCDDFYVITCVFVRIGLALTVVIPDVGIELHPTATGTTWNPLVSWSASVPLVRVFRGHSQDLSWSVPALHVIDSESMLAVRPIGTTYVTTAIDLPIGLGNASQVRARVGARQSLEAAPYVTAFVDLGAVYASASQAGGVSGELGFQFHRNLDPWRISFMVMFRIDDYPALASPLALTVAAGFNTF